MIAGVLLAAGAARRFDGSQKLLAALPVGGDQVPLVRRSVDGLLAAGLKRIVVVIGREADEVRRSLEGLDLQFVTNAAYATGLSSSLRAGVAEAMQLWPKAEWLLIALGDQPLAGTGVVEALVRTSAHIGSGRGTPRIIAPRFAGESGNPVLFSRELAPELLVASGDRGARSVIEREPGRVRYVEFDFPAPIDIDTVQDLATLRDRQRGS